MVLTEDGEAERLAQALLELVGDYPGRFGRLRASRMIAGHSVPYREDENDLDFSKYRVPCSWTLSEVTRLTDRMIVGGLLTQTLGPRSVLVLTRTGHHTLDALQNAGAYRLLPVKGEVR